MLSSENKILTKTCGNVQDFLPEDSSKNTLTESDKSTRWIKEAVHIQKEGRQSLNRDEGSYTLSHTYDRFLATSHHYCGKNRKNN